MQRSYLFVPGDRPERFSKAFSSAAHRVVIDLEDAVSPDAKIRAREQLADWLRVQPSEADRLRLVVRVNAAGTPWHMEDVAMLRELDVGQAMVPKAESADQLADVAARCGERVALTALVESVEGIVRLREIAHAPAVARLAFGSFDYCADAGIEGMGHELDAVRSALVIESRFAGLPAPVDGVTLAIDDAPRIARDVAFARGFGFGGKLCIHPKQVEPVNQGFAPSAEEREWAARVLARFAENPHGAFAVDGKLVDKPVIDRARRIAAAS